MSKIVQGPTRILPWRLSFVWHGKHHLPFRDGDIRFTLHHHCSSLIG
jgi:hypothetical protein